MKLNEIIISLLMTLTCNIIQTACVTHWNPIIDECNTNLNLIVCQPTIDGTIQPDEYGGIKIDAEFILEKSDSGETMNILSKRNFLQRRAIDKYYSEMLADKTLFNRFYDDANQSRFFTDLLSELLHSVSNQYKTVLWCAATVSSDNRQEYGEMHGTIVFTTILGGMSNIGLKHLYEITLESEDSEIDISLEEQMRTIGKYPEKFIALVMQLMKGERDESLKINDSIFKDDLEKLKSILVNLDSETKEKNTDFLCELLSKRSFAHLNELFSQEGTANFANIYANVISEDSYLASAILELYYMTSNRIKGMAKVLHDKKSSALLNTLIVVSRSEIDLRNIKEVYETEYKQKLSDVNTEMYHREFPLYSQGLLNLLDPPEDISWKS